jgi:predicted nucleotidyltransferase
MLSSPRVGPSAGPKPPPQHLRGGGPDLGKLQRQPPALSIEQGRFRRQRGDKSLLPSQAQASGNQRVAAGSTSLAIYGSVARGDIDERSDLDLLVIGEDSSVGRDKILELQDALGREVQLTLLPYYRWETMKKDGDEFAESVLKKHILVSGVEL